MSIVRVGGTEMRVSCEQDESSPDIMICTTEEVPTREGDTRDYSAPGVLKESVRIKIQDGKATLVPPITLRAKNERDARKIVALKDFLFRHYGVKLR